MYIDIHCHIDMIEREGKRKVEGIIERAKEKRVGVIVENSINSTSNRKTLKEFLKFKEVRAALGIYPINALKMSDKEIDREIDFIRKNKDRVFGIGEVGIDHKWSTDKKEWKKQEEIFRKFVKLSVELDMPVIVHSRKAEEECVMVLEEEKAKKVIMHSFGGRKRFVKRIVDNGWHFSIPASVKNSEHFQNIVETVSIERLFCETDSPYLHPDKKFPNEPANVVEAYRAIAKIKKLKLKEVEKQIEENFRKLIGKGEKE